MYEKINQVLKQYNTQLKRKQGLLQPYLDIKNSIDGIINIKDQEEYSRLKAEVEMLKKHIDDLEWILK